MQRVGNGIVCIHIITYLDYLYTIHIVNADVCEIIFYPFTWLSKVTTFSVGGERGKVGMTRRGNEIQCADTWPSQTVVYLFIFIIPASLSLYLQLYLHLVGRTVV